jgi:hypothetical protein
MPADVPLQPPGDTAWVALGQLLLDPENPRLTSANDNESNLSQDEITRRLWAEMAVDEVALSIAANGYYPEERLLVIPATQPDQQPGSPPRYVVVEGNRRLAAVRLLLDDGLRQQVGANTLPHIDAQRRSKLQRLPVSVYSNRQLLWSYLGFRHINGTKPWDAFSKAKYVAEVHEHYGVDLEEIASRIGDQNKTVRRLYQGLKVLQQAEQQAGFDKQDRMSGRFAFSHLYTAIQEPEFQRYLGVTPERLKAPNPVPKGKLGELGQLMVWLYGRKSTNTPPVVHSQNPDLNILREVISQPKALSALRSGYSLEISREIGTSDARRFIDALTRANEELRHAKGNVTTGYRGERGSMDTIHNIVTLAESIRVEMESILKAQTVAE